MQDVLNIFLIIALVVLVSCVVLITFFLVAALKSFTTLAENTDEVIEGIKGKVQTKALLAIPAILVSIISRILKRR